MAGSCPKNVFCNLCKLPELAGQWHRSTFNKNFKFVKNAVQMRFNVFCPCLSIYLRRSERDKSCFVSEVTQWAVLRCEAWQLFEDEATKTIRIGYIVLSCSRIFLGLDVVWRNKIITLHNISNCLPYYVLNRVYDAIKYVYFIRKIH